MKETKNLAMRFALKEGEEEVLRRVLWLMEIPETSILKIDETHIWVRIPEEEEKKFKEDFEYYFKLVNSYC